MQQIGVGIVGTGYAAKARVEALADDERAQVVAVSGRNPDRVHDLSDPHGALALSDWQELMQQSAVDLVIVATFNRDHGAIAQAALQAGKHVMVEYPLALELAMAEQLVTLAQRQQRMLHVEHIELLSGIHRAIARALPAIGTPLYVRHCTLNPQRPAPSKWTYRLDEFGFPLVGALSRIHRLTNLFGRVATVSCQTQYWQHPTDANTFTTCLCSAQLRFVSGVIADVVYGKGESLWQPERSFSVQGQLGSVVVEGDRGELMVGENRQSLDLGSRKGLFAQDIAAVLDHLTLGKRLYVNVHDSLYALAVAEAARRSADSGNTVALSA
ncbi:MAG: Gfo/Idh/MocA family oxidoreductase [Kaiparowitsia implicata GSE-PSE-MK54-09C]|jgi:biliverdin reductase|nr:Gfo/Idh/MocA family oxidoreductase [Kaiparowitsia implicata GSE-PSE-MK54-09C]